jgi:hypothetical protein
LKGVNMIDTDKEYSVKSRYSHFRVPSIDNLKGLRRGSPEEGHLFSYSRGVGWIEKSSGVGGNTWKNIRPLERGGKTVCEMVDSDGNVVVRGVAVCSFSDHFSYMMGRRIAFGRALSKYSKESKQTG